MIIRFLSVIFYIYMLISISIFGIFTLFMFKDKKTEFGAKCIMFSLILPVLVYIAIFNPFVMM